MFAGEKSEGKKYTREERGSLHTLSYRMYLRNEIGPISPIHDIPLYANKAKKIYNIVNEVPRWTNAKMEMCWKQQLNPILHDLDGTNNIRYYPNVFPHHGSIWNYGSLPQTWECPLVKDKTTGCFGDNDPVDVLEIGYKVAKMGEVRQVKLLGAIGLVDQGATDWKVLALDVTDPLADNVNDIGDMDKSFHGMVEATVHWFTVYKLNEGKPENVFVFSGKPQNREFAQNLVKLSHKYWKVLIAGKVKTKSMMCVNTTVKNSPYRISKQEAENIVQASSEPSPAAKPSAHAYSWFYAEVIRKQMRMGTAVGSYNTKSIDEYSFMKTDSSSQQGSKSKNVRSSKDDAFTKSSTW